MKNRAKKKEKGRPGSIENISEETYKSAGSLRGKKPFTSSVSIRPKRIGE
jgi:hypothetical protein